MAAALASDSADLTSASNERSYPDLSLVFTFFTFFSIFLAAEGACAFDVGADFVGFGILTEGADTDGKSKFPEVAPERTNPRAPAPAPKNPYRMVESATTTKEAKMYDPER